MSNKVFNLRENKLISYRENQLVLKTGGSV